LSALVGSPFAELLRSLKPQHEPSAGRKALVAFGPRDGCSAGYPTRQHPSSQIHHHNHRGKWGALPARGAGHSAGLSMWGAGWWLRQAAGVRSPWLLPNLSPKLAGQLWLSFLMSLWPSSFPIEAGKSLLSLLGNCSHSGWFAGRSRVWVAAADVPVDGGATGKGDACSQWAPRVH